MVAERVRRECAAGYDEGTLRAYLDGELESAASGALQAHARDCAACSEELMRLRLDGALVQGRLALLDAGVPGAAGRRPPVAAVLAAAQRREQAGWHAALLGAAARLQEAMAPPWRPAPLAGGLAAGAALLVGVAFTQPAVQSFAQGVAQSLRVQKVQPVTLDLSQLGGTKLPTFDQLLSTGTYSGPLQPTIKSAEVADASKAIGFTLRAPKALPAQVSGSRSVWLANQTNFTFTYDGQKLAQLAQQYGVTDADLLAQLHALNGTTVKGTIPAAAAVVYGDVGPLAAQAAATKEAAKQSAAKAANVASQAPANAQPFLTFIQLKSPSLDVPANVNVDYLRAEMLKSGALPPQLAGQLLAIQDWKTTLPVPVIKGTSEQVSVDGVTGALVVEGPGAVLYWQKNGALYVMFGSVSKQDLLAAAGSLAPAQ